MNHITAIPTKYKGYQFRSRLEARWAVYFDTLEIKWEYEKEGYELEDGTWYLPDFWLPQVNMWAEVKGEKFTSEEYVKCCGLAKLTKHPVLMLSGMPDLVFYKSVEYFEDDNTLRIDKNSINDYHGYYRDEHRFYAGPGCVSPMDEGVVTETQIQAIYFARSADFKHNTKNIKK